MSMDWINHFIFVSMQITLVVSAGCMMINHSRNTSSHALYWIFVVLGTTPCAIVFAKWVLPYTPVALLPEPWLQASHLVVSEESAYTRAFIWVAGFYFSILLCRLVPFFYGLLRIWQRSYTAEKCSNDDVLMQIHQNCRSLCRVRLHSIKLKISNEIDSPMTWGAWRPVVLLPASYTNWSSGTLERFLLHEYKHIQRFDWLIAQSFEFIGHILWFVPGLSTCRKRLAWQAELSCDDFVLSGRHSRSSYAADLLGLAKNQQKKFHQGPLAALYTLDRSEIFLRISHVLEPAKVAANDTFRIWIFLVVFYVVVIPFSTLKLVQWQKTSVPVHYPYQIDKQHLYLFSEDAKTGKQR